MARQRSVSDPRHGAPQVPELGGADVRHAAASFAGLLVADAARDWSARAGELTWSVSEVAAHVADVCGFYAIRPAHAQATAVRRGAAPRGERGRPGQHHRRPRGPPRAGHRFRTTRRTGMAPLGDVQPHRLRRHGLRRTARPRQRHRRRLGRAVRTRSGCMRSRPRSTVSLGTVHSGPMGRDSVGQRTHRPAGPFAAVERLGLAQCPADGVGRAATYISGGTRQLHLEPDDPAVATGPSDGNVTTSPPNSRRNARLSSTGLDQLRWLRGTWQSSTW